MLNFGLRVPRFTFDYFMHADDDSFVRVDSLLSGEACVIVVLGLIW